MRMGGRKICQQSVRHSQFQLMSQRQHLHRRTHQHPEPATLSQPASSHPHTLSPQKSPPSAKTRPTFPPTDAFYPYSKDDYKKAKKPFPPPESLYSVRDTEVDPCFLRATTMALHVLPRKTRLPVGVWVSPFASERVSVVSLRAPVRCGVCRAYVNPYFQFDGSGRAVTCNLCGARSAVEAAADRANFQSAEVATQPVIDFRVSDQVYFKRRTDLVRVVVAVELSMNTLQLGVFAAVLAAVRSALQTHTFGEKLRLAVVFYSDQGVGYLQRGEQGGQPTVFLVPDSTHTPCCPLSDQEMLFDPAADRQQLMGALDFLEEYGNSYWRLGRFTHTANYLRAVRSLKECFEQQTGKILLFSYLAPVEVRRGVVMEETKLRLRPMHLQAQELGRELVRLRVGVEQFFFSRDRLVRHELATTHFLSSLTGGELHLYGNYEPSSTTLYYHVFHALTRPTYFDVDFTCRVSPGLSVLRYGLGQGLREGREVAVSTCTSCSSFMVEVEQEEKLQEGRSFLQFALLYTTAHGDRRVRVITFRFDLTHSLEPLYDSLDYLTLANFIVRTAAQRLLKVDQLQVREETIGWVANLISEFQGRCEGALSVRVGEVVVPEGMAWALHYLQSLLASPLMALSHPEADDTRTHEYLQLQTATPYSFASRYYPHLYPLTLDIYDSPPLPGDFLEVESADERVAVLPGTVALTRGSLLETGVYLYAGREQLVVLVQPRAEEELLVELFGSSNWEQLEQGLPELDTPHNIRAHNIVAELRRRNAQHGGMHQPLLVRTPLRKKTYADFVNSLLREDAPDCTFASFMQQIAAAVKR